MDSKQIGYIFNSGLSKNMQIAELLKLEYPRNEIMTMVKCGPNLITMVKKSLKLTGEVPEQAKIGRPSKKTAATSAFITQCTFNNPYISAADIKVQLFQKNGTEISESTINNYRADSGYKFLPPVKEPQLTTIQIQKRINFCYSVLLHRNELPNIGFSDESRFSLGGDKRWLWRKRNEYNPNCIVPQVKFPTSIMIWGMIAPNYKPAIFIFEENENSQNYIDMLCEESILLDAQTFFEGDFAFQQDGARPHTANMTIDFITKVCDVIVNWPPNSPDLNVIEMVWSLIEKTISFYHPNNKEELVDSVRIAWNHVSMQTINKLCNSFLRRCFLCLQNGGKCINHLLQKEIIYEVTDEEISELFDKLKRDGISLTDIEFLKRKIE